VVVYYPSPHVEEVEVLNHPGNLAVMRKVLKAIEESGSPIELKKIDPVTLKFSVNTPFVTVDELTRRADLRHACGEGPCQCGGSCGCGGAPEEGETQSLSLAPDYGYSNAALPRGASAQRVLRRYGAHQVVEITGQPGAGHKATVRANKKGERERFFIGTVAEVSQFLGQEWLVRAF